MKAILITFILASFTAGYSNMDIPVLIISAVFCVAFSFNCKKSVIFNIMFSVLIICVFFSGTAYYSFSEKKIVTSADKLLKSDFGVLNGTVISESNVFSRGSSFFVKTDDGNIISVRYNSKKEVGIGDKVKIENFDLIRISNYNKRNRTVKKYLGKKCLLETEIYAKNLTVTGMNNLYKPLNFAYKLKKETFYNLLKYLSYDKATLAQGVFTSDKEHLPDEIYDMLVKTSTIHIATVSGFHFNLLGMLMLFIMKLFFGSHKKRIFVVSVLMIGFAFYTGLSFPVLRALITFLAVSVSELLDFRPAGKKSVFLLIIFGFILQSPLIVFDISFVLTLISNGSIVFFCIPEEKQYFTDKKIYVPVNSIIINLIMLPFIFSLFGRISLVGVLTNLCLEVVMGPILLLTGFLAMFSQFFSPLAYLISKILGVFLEYFLLILKIFSVPDNMSPKFPLTILTAVFSTSFFISAVYVILLKDRRKITVLISSILAFAVCIAVPNFSDNVYLTFCGSYTKGAVFTKNSHHIVIASSSEFLYSGSDSLLNQNETVDLWLVTKKFDTKMLESLVEKYRIKKIAVPQELYLKSYKGKIPIEVIDGERFDFDFYGVKLSAYTNGEYILSAEADYKGNKLIVSDEPEFYYNKLENINKNADFVYYEENLDRKKFKKSYVKIPENIKLHLIKKEFNLYSLGIFNDDGFEFK